MAQENSLADGRLDLDRLLRDGELVLEANRYGRLMRLGSSEGCPIVTFTCPKQGEMLRYAKPSARYLRTIASGLLETFELSVPELVGYLGTKSGVSGNYPPSELTELVGLVRP